MNKIFGLLLIGSIFAVTSYKYNGSTTAPVVIAGSVIKAQNVENTKKYKRKDCPVCKGKGFYISGDGISKVDCGYCEPDQGISAPAYQPPKVLVHPPITIKPNCQSGTCIIKR